ncbi:MAG: hypothetical protein QOJ65_217 [Fimbriimonadaceae bacterium]|jgi:hypothetical protein|nr:hypothetical protein [Fimbriimonadaceae bacterium]
MPSLSLAVMVRDDAARLKRCIDAAQKAVDQVVVLDTGSKDDTVEVARAAGAHVEQIEWPGSFSIGLNRLLDMVTTDWVLRLDSDEWFEADPKERLLKLMGKKDVYGHKLIRRDILEDGRFREISIFRLWRNDPRLRYEGLVHENISNRGIEEAFARMTVGNSSLWFWHDGYSKGSEAKLRRNIELIENELTARPDQPYYQAMRAVMYRDLEDPRASALIEQAADEALTQKEASTRMVAGVFSSLLQDTPDDQLNSTRVSSVIERAWQWFPDYPGVLWAIGTAELRRQNSKGSLKAFLALEELAASGRYERTMPFDPAILGAHLWNALGYAAQQVGRHDILERCARKLQNGPR